MEKSEIEATANEVVSWSLKDPEKRASLLLMAEADKEGIGVHQSGAGNAMVLVDAIAHSIVREKAFGKLIMTAVQKAKIMSSLSDLSGKIGLN